MKRNRYQFHRYCRLERYPSYRAALAVEAVLHKAEAIWQGDPSAHQQFVAAAAAMRRALVIGFANPVGSRARAAEHRNAWIATQRLDALLAKTLRSDPHAKRLVKDLGVLRRAVDRADVLISALPGAWRE